MFNVWCNKLQVNSYSAQVTQINCLMCCSCSTWWMWSWITLSFSAAASVRLSISIAYHNPCTTAGQKQNQAKPQMGNKADNSKLSLDKFNRLGVWWGRSRLVGGMKARNTIANGMIIIYLRPRPYESLCATAQLNRTNVKAHEGNKERRERMILPRWQLNWATACWISNLVSPRSTNVCMSEWELRVHYTRGNL